MSTTIAVYKFTNLSREEVEAMLGLNLEESQIYQEVKQVGRLEREAEILAVTVPLLLKAGMAIEDIAEQLNVAVEVVQRVAQDQH